MANAERTGLHGLPAEYRTADGQTESWQTTLGYLAALEKSRRPIVLAVDPGNYEGHATQQVGFLRHQGQHRPLPSQPAYEHFNLYWPDPEQLAGNVALYEHLFEGATLSTIDGDDYFWLTLGFGALRIVFLDSSTNLDQAHPTRKRQLDDLPTADDLSREFAARGENEFARTLRAQVAGIREQLVALGAERAAQMSDEDILAEGVRVRWKLRQHLVQGESLKEADWIAGVADSLRSED